MNTTNVFEDAVRRNNGLMTNDQLLYVMDENDHRREMYMRRFQNSIDTDEVPGTIKQSLINLMIDDLSGTKRKYYSAVMHRDKGDEGIRMIVDKNGLVYQVFPSQMTLEHFPVAHQNDSYEIQVMHQGGHFLCPEGTSKEEITRRFWIAAFNVMYSCYWETWPELFLFQPSS